MVIAKRALFETYPKLLTIKRYLPKPNDNNWVVYLGSLLSTTKKQQKCVFLGTL